MKDTTFKRIMTSYSGDFLALIIILQPLLDVLSYFMIENGTTVISTSIRTILLLAVVFYGFYVSDSKKNYLILFGILVGFWLLHALNLMRGGYSSPMLDLAEYLKLIQFPLWTFSFITFIKINDCIIDKIISAIALNFLIILLVIGVSYLTRKPVYTYDYANRGIQLGILGWFGDPNSQSAIVSILTPLVMLWAYQKKIWWLFAGVTAIGMSLLYLTGTRLAFYSALIILLAYFVLIIFNREYYSYLIVLVVIFALFLIFKGASPMEKRQDLTSDSYSIYQEKTDEVMGDDKDFVYVEGEEIPTETLEKIKRVYTEVYSGVGIYGNPLLGDLIDKFGIDRVMEEYDYSIRAEKLYNVRTKRIMFVRLSFEDKDVLTKILGINFSEVYVGDNIYAPENDIQPLVYFYGYLGCAIYILFLAYLAYICIRAVVVDFPEIVTVKFGIIVSAFVLLLGAAHFSGHILRRPSVLSYLSLFAAMIYCMSDENNYNKKAYKRKNRFILSKKIY